jgi:hypothetical protein
VGTLHAVAVVDGNHLWVECDEKAARTLTVELVVPGVVAMHSVKIHLHTRGNGDSNGGARSKSGRISSSADGNTDSNGGARSTSNPTARYWVEWSFTDNSMIPAQCEGKRAEIMFQLHGGVLFEFGFAV